MNEQDRNTLWEDPAVADCYRQAYVDGINKCLSRLNEEAQQQRWANIDIHDQAGNRARLKEMLGVALFEKQPTRLPQLIKAGETDLAEIYRLTVYITDEIPFYALLQLPKQASKPLPLVIAQHGGGGTPELCSDLYGKNNYSGMVRRCLQRGAAVLAPQLLLWATEETEIQRCHPVPFNRTKTDALLKRFGASITGLEICGIRRCLDYVCERNDIDAMRVGMMGISYGGYFTLHTMALEERIKVGYSVAAFNSRDMHCFCDWSYYGAAYCLQDAEVVALCAPRKLYVQVGMEDAVFDYRGAVTEAQRAQQYYAQLNAEDCFRFDLWSGGHTISDHEGGFDFLFGAL